MADKMRIVIGRVPEEEHRDLKAKLAQEGKSIQDFIARKVEEYLKEN